MKIFRVKYGETFISEDMVFSGGLKEKKIPIILSFFVIQTAASLILVDAGCDTMPGFELKNHIRPVDAINNIGFSSTDVTDVVITHGHHDHIDAVRHFPNATVYIQTDEYKQAMGYIPDGFTVNLFQDDFILERGIKIVKAGGHTVGSCVVEVENGDKITVLCGDECYTFYNIDNKVPTAASYCKEKSIGFINKYTQEKYNCLLCHDIK